MILFAQATFNASAGWFIQSFCLLQIILNQLLFYIIKFSLGWITPAIQSLQKRVAPCLNIICNFDRSDSHIFLLSNKNYAKSHEEQDSSKQKFVGGMTAKLWPIFHQGVAKNTEEK